MTISVWGWGATQISTWGWGSWIYEYVPDLILDYTHGPAYSCAVDTTGCVVVMEATSNSLVMRLRPCDIPERVRGEVLLRVREQVSIRSGGWPFQSEPCFGS